MVSFLKRKKMPREKIVSGSKILWKMMIMMFLGIVFVFSWTIIERQLSTL
jgi:hypothetical protein